MEQRATADLARSGIEPEEAEAAGMYFTPDASTLYADFKPLPALVLPYSDITGAPVTFADGKPFCRVRYLEVPPKAGSFLKLKPLRYGQPTGSGTRAYFPRVRGLDWQRVAADVKQPLILTEGEKKALSTTLAGFDCIGLGGVHNFLREGELLPELNAFKWHGREVYIAFDSDAAANPNIQFAEARLVDELMRVRGARVYLTRLPAEGDDKVGLDDFLMQHDVDKLKKLFADTEYLGAVDAAVVALNRYVAWIERDGGIYDIRARHFIKTSDFTKGSQYSAERARRVITTGKKPGVKEVSVSTEWLTHPLARRYGDMLFRPGEPPMVETEHGAPAFNVWHGWEERPGNVMPFLRLSAYLFGSLPKDIQEYAVKLMVYKAQNPTEKVFAIVLTGDQGGGKSLWAQCIADAFRPYSCSLNSQEFLTDFQGWMERNLIAVVNEAKPGHLEQASEMLKTFVTETDHQMNEKYRAKRMVKCFTSFILTANDRGVGAFAHDDRRMYVVNCPSTHPAGREFYGPIHEWRKAGGGAQLMHWLLNYDLQGWTPGAKPPTTAEKAMARREGLTDIEQAAETMRTATEHLVMMWIDAAMQWAERVLTGNGNATLARHAQEIIDSYNSIQVRDWYTPNELAAMFPQIASALYGNRRTQKTVSGEMSRQLRNAGIRYLECSDDPEGFLWRGQRQQFLIVSNRDDWTKPISQAEFERCMQEFPRYAEVKQSMKRQARAVK